MTDRLIAEHLVERMTARERELARRVESVLPALRERAAQADTDAQFQMPHVKTLGEAGLLGLVVPEEYGGLGGTLRDLAAPFPTQSPRSAPPSIRCVRRT